MSMDKKIIIELIKLEVLSQCSPEDTEALKFLKRNDENFPWKEYGDYQNLTAVLSIRPEPVMPKQSLKNEIISKACKLKNITIPENHPEEILVEEPVSITLKESNSEEPEVYQKPENVLPEPSQQNNDDPETIIEEVEENESEERLDSPHDFILLKEPNLFKLQNNDEEPPGNVIEEANSELENISEEKDEFESDSEINKINDSDDIEVENEEEAEEIIISEESIQPDSDILNELHNDEDKNKKPSYATNKKSLNRNSKSYVITLIAVIVISVPLIFFLTSSKESVDEEKKQLIKKPVRIENTAVNTDLLESDKNGIVSVEGINEVTKEDLTVVGEKVKTNQPPPLPEPVFAEAKDLEIVGADMKNSPKEIIQIEPPKEIKTVEKEPAYFIAVEEMPQPIGGLGEIQKRVIYPRIASLSGTEGKVIIQAIVDETGNVSNAEIIKGIGSGCDEAALKAVFETKFKPGKQRGKAVKVRMTIPIVFKK